MVQTGSPVSAECIQKLKGIGGGIALIFKRSISNGTSSPIGTKNSSPPSSHTE